MNDFRRMPAMEKWSRSPLKSSWYDDHYGFGATPMEVVENRLLAFAERFLPNNEEQIASDEVERFFDLFESPKDA